jgi:hypothetical protein
MTETPTATPQPGEGAPTLRIGTVLLGVGATGKVTLEGLDFVDPGLSAWTIDVHFDPTVVEELPPPPLFEVGTARVGGAAALGRVGDFQLASVSFRCLVEGQTALTLEVVVLRDGTPGDPHPIAANVINGQVFCGIVPTVTRTPSATPTPTITPTPGTPTPHTPTPGGGPTPGESPTPGIPAGDADCNHAVSSIDAALILQFGAGLLHSLACQDAADVNSDLHVDSRDAALILQYLAALIPSLPA